MHWQIVRGMINSEPLQLVSSTSSDWQGRRSHRVNAGIPAGK